MRSAARELAALLGEDALLDPDTPPARAYMADATESRALQGTADAIVLARDGDDVARTMAWCYANDVPLVPRGAGTGYAGGAVPLGGVVLSLEELRAPLQVDAATWRARVGAGVVTGQLRRRAREEGLLWPVDPGSQAQCTIGGNIATNAGGPHSFRYGVTGTWVTGLEVVIAPGEVVELGGTVRKDVAGYDVRSLFVGSEGTLGVVTAAWLKLVPAPEAAFPVMGLYADLASGCDALAAVRESGLGVAALEFLDGNALTAALPGLVGSAPDLDLSSERPGFAVLAEAEGSAQAAGELREELCEALAPGALALHAPTGRGEVTELWRWRDGVSVAVTSVSGGKVSEDIAVPVERFEEALVDFEEIGRRHGLPTCSWGHAGDGNIHATFMIDRGERTEVERAEAAAQELMALAARLGGSVTGEHGIGIVKRGGIARQWDARAVGLHDQIKRVFDPKGLLNPGKKLAR